ncbi:MAG: heavy metal-binding domain-containing protein [Planctomycetota bacterium]
MVELIINLGIFVFLLALGFFAGTTTERRHFRRLEEREEENRGFVVTQLKTFPGGSVVSPAPQIFMAEAVIASDYLKTFLSGIRKFFGGELKSYESLLERARREALLRIIDQARAAGYDTACNLRYETADIGGATNPKKGVVTVAVIATATAYRRKQAG